MRVSIVKKFFSRVATLATIILLLTITNLDVKAAQAPEENEIEPLYSYTSTVSSSLDIVNGDAICYTSVDGYYDTTTKITITQTLQKKSGSSWVKVWSWTNTVYGWNYDYVNYHYPLTAGTYYRVYAVIKVYSGSNYETIYSYSTADYYGG